MNCRGQTTIAMVLIFGTFLAFIVLYGWQRNQQLQGFVNTQDSRLVANDVLSAAARKMQQIYSSEASCDPDIFEARVAALPTAPGGGYNGLSYVIADTSTGLTADQRVNRCAAASGCRQIPVDQNGRAYLVTVGLVSSLSRPAPLTANERCSRDATIKLKTTIRQQAFSRQYTLINTCSYTSCTGGNFSGVTGNQSAAPAGANTTACGLLGARPYGDIVGTDGAPDGVVNEHELRWARRYLETGAYDIGTTTFLAATLTTTNGSCAAGTGGCLGKNCIPYFDLNKDGANNEADLAILEYYLRGYIPELPVRDF